MLPKVDYDVVHVAGLTLRLGELLSEIRDVVPGTVSVLWRLRSLLLLADLEGREVLDQCVVPLPQGLPLHTHPGDTCLELQDALAKLPILAAEVQVGSAELGHLPAGPVLPGGRVPAAGSQCRHPREQLGIFPREARVAVAQAVDLLLLGGGAAAQVGDLALEHGGQADDAEAAPAFAAALPARQVAGAPVFPVSQRAGLRVLLRGAPLRSELRGGERCDGLAAGPELVRAAHRRLPAGIGCTFPVAPAQLQAPTAGHRAGLPGTPRAPRAVNTTCLAWLGVAGSHLL
mmetsp:Transcript_35554/g.80260  ORF Transcript_35554/g.80260 Transcript_35554/m.80260 type:complete len:288 (+) Transcript_35554:263-1126(+)